MLTKRETRLSQILIAVQVLLSLFLFWGLKYIFPQYSVSVFEELFFVSQILLFWAFLFYKFKLGFIFRNASLESMLRGYLATLSIGGLFMMIEIEIIRLFFHHNSYNFLFILSFLIINFLVLVIFKSLFYSLMRYIRREGYNSHRVIIVGDYYCEKFISSFIRVADWGYNLLAVVTPDDDFANAVTSNTCLIKDQQALKQYITINTVDDIFYCLSIYDERYNIITLIEDANEIGVAVHLMNDEVFVKHDFNLGERENQNNIFETYQSTPDKYLSLKIKGITDLVVSALILVLTSPLFLLIALLIKIEDGGPVFFRQERIGLNGRRFNCLKFRSMVINAEAQLDKLKDMNESDGPTFKITNDPRITKVGKILRKTSFDELPQFYNVLHGDMSIVGPRPPLLKEVKQYERSQLRRLSMKPGITCIWQVKGRNIVSFREWMEMDLQYIDNWSLWLDVKLFFATICVIFKANGK
jgi:exopolysaccharide biosynthesis polyprenyl glycosylphosphotransferase